MAWLKKQKGPPIFVESKGNLERDLIQGTNSDGNGKIGGGRFASIPCFTAPPPESRPEKFKEGRVNRQCTPEYKTHVVEWVIRRRVLGLEYRQRFPQGVHVHQSFGFDALELGRKGRLEKRYRETIPWATPHFPLIGMGWTRKDCVEWLKPRVPHRVQRSACVFCPYKDNREWKELRDESPEEWERAITVDRALREEGTRDAEGMSDKLWLHRTCIPLELVDLSEPQPPRMLDLFTEECEGMCGN